MLVLVGDSDGIHARAASIRRRLNAGDACSVADLSSLPGDDFARWRHAAADILVGHAAAGARRIIAILPERWFSRAGELAFTLRRRHAQACFAVRDEEWSDLDRLASRLAAGQGRITPIEPEPPLIVTPRLRLTFATPAQVEGYYRAIAGTDMFRTLIWDGPTSPDELLDYALASRQAHARGPENDLNLAIIESASDLQIGGCSLRPGMARNASYNLGYTLAPAWQGRGLGSEAVGAMVDFAFRERAAARCWAEVFEGNARSRRVLERLGFGLEGHTRSAVAKGGTRLGEWILGLTREDWQRAAR